MLSSKNQTENPEVIVVNDGSVDSTAELARTRGARVISHPKNMGAATAYNTGIFFSTADFIALLSADDRYITSQVLERLLSKMEETNADFAFCQYNYQGPSFKAFQEGQREKREKALTWMLHISPFWAVWFNNPIAGSSVMLRKSSIERFGRFDPKLRNQDPDGDLWLRWLKQGAKLAIAPSLGTFYTHHPGQSSKDKFAWYGSMTRTRLRALL